MDTRKIYDGLCANSRLDPNALLYVNGVRYNVLIDTVELDKYNVYGEAVVKVGGKINSPGYINGNNLERTYKEGRTYSPTRYVNGSKIKKVIFNDPATIVFWSDGTKTVVKCQDGDMFDLEKGLAMAIAKKAMGNQGNYCNELKKWLPKCCDATVSADDLIKSGKTAYISGGSPGLSGTVPAIEDLHRVASEIKERMKDIWDLI